MCWWLYCNIPTFSWKPVTRRPTTLAHTAWPDLGCSSPLPPLRSPAECPLLSVPNPSEHDASPLGPPESESGSPSSKLCWPGSSVALGSSTSPPFSRPGQARPTSPPVASRPSRPAVPPPRAPAPCTLELRAEPRMPGLRAPFLCPLSSAGDAPALGQLPRPLVPPPPRE